jgi:ketosteroid isomerase-like protein
MHNPLGSQAIGRVPHYFRRMSIRSPLLLAIALLGGPLCSACENPAPAVDPAALLRQAEEQAGSRLFSYPRVVLSGQLDSIMSYWAPDVRIFENEARVRGDSALRAIGKQFFAQFDVTRLAYAPTETVAHDSDSVVYQFGYFTEDSRRKGRTAVTNAGNNFAARWVRDAAGTWRFQRLFATPAPRPSAPIPTVPAIPPVPGPAPDKATISQRMADYTHALTTHDPVRILAFWAEDGRYMEPNIELNDKPAITRFVNERYDGRKSELVDLSGEEVFVHQGVAYVLGSCSPCLVPGSTRRHSYIVRWKSHADGKWLIDRFIATLAPPGPDPLDRPRHQP